MSDVHNAKAVELGSEWDLPMTFRGSEKTASSRGSTGTYIWLLDVPGDLRESSLVPSSDTRTVKR